MRASAEKTPPAPSLAGLRFLECMERVNVAIQRSSDLERMMEDVLGTVLSLFECDRAWLLFPCNPEAPAWKVPMECTRPEYPGAHALNTDVPMEPGKAEVMRAVLRADRPVEHGVHAELPLSEDVVKNFHVQAQLATAIHPKVGEPWMFGIHQCSYARAWTAEEKAIFTEIGRRVADGLSALLILRDLRESEERMRVLADGLPGVVYGKVLRPTAAGQIWERVYMSSGIKELLGPRLGSEVLEDVNRFAELVHPDDQPAFQERVSTRDPDSPLPDIEYRVRTDSGDYIWVRSIVRINRQDENALLWHGILLDVTERRRAQEKLRFTQFAIDHAADAALWVRSDGRITYVNRAAERLLGWSSEELLVRGVADLWPTRLRRTWVDTWRRVREGGSMTFELHGLAKDGREFPVEISMNLFEFAGEEYAITFVRDVSVRQRAQDERDRLEAQLRQAQKLEAIGRLAGGVAHDFNNILTAILGHADLALADLDGKRVDAESLGQRLRSIARNARLAGGLTRQLLVFGRRDVAHVEILDLGAVLAEMEDVLRWSIPEETSLELEFDDGPHLVCANRGQIEQVVMNLVTNARDALRDGGQVRVRVSGARPPGGDGALVVLAVSDTGCGMDAAVAERIFEPFFTTKPLGQGTGLGLSVVYGIVRQAGGRVEFDTTPGEGTTFRVLFPAAAAPGPVAAVEDAAPVPAGGETILVCEDDESVRRLIAQMIAGAGYRVLAAESGPRALELAERNGEAIDVLVTDLVMPGMSGKELAETLSARRPGLRTIFVSGYSHDVLAAKDLVGGEIELLEKPFSRWRLLQRIRDVLEVAP
ncbi:MAG: PAS domain S-box protein [Planctomycetota bacterium]